MSRGLGKLQRHIMDTLYTATKSVWWASAFEDDSDEGHPKAVSPATRRAIRGLVKRGLVCSGFRYGGRMGKYDGFECYSDGYQFVCVWLPTLKGVQCHPRGEISREAIEQAALQVLAREPLEYEGGYHRHSWIVRSVMRQVTDGPFVTARIRIAVGRYLRRLEADGIVEFRYTEGSYYKEKIRDVKVVGLLPKAL